MQVKMQWMDGMVFSGEAAGNLVPMDAKTPIGKGSAPTPKELVALGLGGCSAMDVIAYLKKFKQVPTSFAVDVDIETSTGKMPAVFNSALLTYSLEGPVESDKAIEAVHLSQTKFCGVSMMLSRSFPIRYRILLNGVEIGSGHAEFAT